MKMSRKKFGSTFLTEEQVRVLRLRAKGYSGDRIAKELGMTRSNAYAVLKSALRNVERAKKTLELYMEIFSSVTVEIRKGTKLLEVPPMVYRTADEYGIKVGMKSAELVAFLEESASNLFENGEAVRNFKLKLTRDGRVEVER